MEPFIYPFEYITYTYAHSQCNHRFEGAHGKQVGHHRAESRRQAGLSDESEFQLRQTYDVVAPLPVPARNVQEVGLKDA